MVNQSVKIVLVVLMALAVVSMVGCRGSTLPPGGVADPLPRANYPRVVVLEGLQPYIAVTEPIVVKEEGRPLHVTVPLRAATRREELNTQYRFVFLDEQGRTVPPEQNWKYIRLPSRAQRHLEANAVDDRAVDWRMEIRPAR